VLQFGGQQKKQRQPIPYMKEKWPQTMH